MKNFARVLGAVALLVNLWLAGRYLRSSAPLPEEPLIKTESSRELAPGVSFRVASVEGHDWHIADFAVDLQLATLEVGHSGTGSWLQDLVPPGAVAAVNGAFFEPDWSPTGWLVGGGAQLGPRNERRQHAVLAVWERAAFVGLWEQLWFEPEIVLQNDPLLAVDGKIVSRVDDDGHPRTVACTGLGHTVHLIAILPESENGPSLHQAAKLVMSPSERGGFGCVSAIALDGGPSSGYWLPGDQGSRPPRVRIGHAVAIVPRTK